jgi:AAA+ ATPase superfamily predicted ATPase
MIAIYGRRRQGKSTLALSIALSRSDTVVVFDPANMYGNLPVHVLSDYDSFDAAIEVDKVFRIVPSDPAAAWEELSDYLDSGSFRWRDYVLIIDEISLIQSPHYLPVSLERFVRLAPKDITVIVTTHRPVDTHNLLRSLAYDVFVFQTNLKRDLNYFADNYSPQLAAIATELGPHEVAHFWLGKGGKVCIERWSDPTLWYVDIGRKN